MSGTTLEKLQVLIEAETRPFRAELDKMQNELRRTTNLANKETSKIKKSFIGIKSTLGGLAIGAGLIKIGKDSLKFASDLQEVQNVVDVAFGDMSYKVENFSKNAIKQFGMSELTAKRTSGTYMAMGRGIGLAAKPASNMAIELSKLSGDVASFFNISQSEAAVKLQSVFTGETETLKQLGVVMTQTNLKQYAMDHGLNSNIESMDQASLTMLRYMFVMDSLKLAQGDFARTSGSWANQIRILQEQWKQLTGIIGNGLIAMFTPVVHVINVVLEKIIYFAQVVSAVFNSLFGKKGKEANKGTKQMQQSLGGAETSASGLNNQLDKTAGKAKKAAKEMGQLASIDEINNMSKSSDGGSGSNGGASGIGNLGDFDLGIGEDADIDTSGIDKAVEKVEAKVKELKEFLEKYKAPITAAMAGIIASLATLWAIKNWTSLVAPIQGVFIWLSNLVKVLGVGPAGWQALITGALGVSAPMVALVTIVGSVTAALVYLWQTNDDFKTNVIESVQILMDILNNFYVNILQPLFGFLSDIFVTVLMPIAAFIADVVVTAVDAVATVLLNFWKHILAPVVDFIIDVAAIALQGIIEIWEAWKPAIEVAYGAVAWIWNEILKPLIAWITEVFIKKFEELGVFIKELLSNIKDMFQGLIEFLVGRFTGDSEKAWEGITKIFQGFDDFLTNIFKHDWTENFGALGAVMNVFFDVVSKVWNGVKKIFTTVLNFVKGTFKTDWSTSWNSIKTTFKNVWESLKGYVKGPINAIIGFVNKMISAVESGVNSVIRALNRISFNVPDWIPSIGGSHFGFDLNTISLGRIPKLARGTIVTHATPAVFGEAGAEAVVPLENHTGWINKIAHGISEFMGNGFNDDLDDLIMIMQEVRDVLIELKNKDNDVYIDGDRVTDNINRLNRLKALRTG